MKCYAIHSWKTVFESPIAEGARATLSIPLKQGMGYIELAGGVNGAAAYGVWVSMLRIALESVTRGVLIYTSREGLKPHDDESLAKVTLFARKDVAAAISRLLDVGWLEEVEMPETAAPAPAQKRDVLEFVGSLGGLRVFKGEDLRPGWMAAIKGLTPKQVVHVFKAAKIGIQKPWESNSSASVLPWRQRFK